MFSPQFNEIYHSRHGAIQESKHVFIQHGLAQIDADSIRIFEVGFGTGLNAFLAFLFAQSSGKKIHYHGLELYPVELEMAQSLNYAHALEAAKFKPEFMLLHTALWNQTHTLGSNFSFHKQQLSALDYNPPADGFDVVFFDAFAPQVQPELWSATMFEKMFALLKTGGRLSTYCAKGDVRRAMQVAGFAVQRLPGPPGKRQMLLGVKN